MHEPRFYVAPIASNWDSTSNWGIISGGPGGASVPGPDNVVYFDGGGQGRCTLDTSVSIYGMRFDPAYVGTVEQGNLPIEIGEDGGTFDGGTFDGGTGDIQINGSASFLGTRFISTKAELRVRNDFYFEQKPTVGSTELLVFEEIQVSSEDISRKYTILSQTPDTTANVVLNIEHGPAQEYDVDYYVEGNFLKWAGKPLEANLTPGDTLQIIYTVLQSPGFFHNRGTVTLNSASSRFYGGGINFYNLDFRQDGTTNLYCQIDSSAFIENTMTLQNGNIKTGYDASGIDSTLFVRGDLIVQSTFGAKDYRNTAQIMIDGEDEQTLVMESGGILPTLTVDKTTSNYLIATGTGPISVFGDLVVTDGTFDTGGLDIQVGTI